MQSISFKRRAALGALLLLRDGWVEVKRVSSNSPGYSLTAHDGAATGVIAATGTSDNAGDAGAG